jgi:hypothetical protein
VRPYSFDSSVEVAGIELKKRVRLREAGCRSEQLRSSWPRRGERHGWRESSRHLHQKTEKATREGGLFCFWRWWRDRTEGSTAEAGCRSERRSRPEGRGAGAPSSPATQAFCRRRRTFCSPIQFIARWRWRGSNSRSGFDCERQSLPRTRSGDAGANNCEAVGPKGDEACSRATGSQAEERPPAMPVGRRSAMDGANLPATSTIKQDRPPFAACLV